MKIDNAPFVQPNSPVVVRSWGDEPVELFLYTIENNGNTGIVGRPDGRHRIGVPIQDIYPMDAQMCELTRTAYASTRLSELQELYEAWRNKYLELVEPIAIDSTHDQAHVAHPESPAGGIEQ
jgi:hypothetical protein